MTTKENKQWLGDAMYGYTEGKFTDRFKYIKLTESAMMKMGTCLGFLSVKEDDRLIDNFFNNLDYLNRTEFTEIPYGVGTRKVPNKITKLSDDGTLFGFGFIHMGLVIEPDLSGQNTEVIGYWGDKYAYTFNGGLIFHGYGNQNFTVSLDNNTGWGIHT